MRDSRTTAFFVCARLALLLVCALGVAVGPTSAVADPAARLPAPLAPASLDSPSLAEDSPETDRAAFAAVRFGRRQFREVQRYVKDHHIAAVDDDDALALAQAASFAVAAAKGGLELLPEGMPLVSGDGPDGGEILRVFRLDTRDPFMIVKRRVSPDAGAALEAVEEGLSEEEAAREREQKSRHHQALMQAWREAGFGGARFSRVMRYAERMARKEGTRLDDVWIAAAQGYLSALDPHSALVSRLAWHAGMNELRDGSFDGIGAIVVRRSRQIVIDDVVSGQPAERAGLRAGDVIVRIDGASVEGARLSTATDKLRGPRGSDVVVTVRRAGADSGEPAEMDIRVTRARIELVNVMSRRLGPEYPDIGYIKVRGFVEKTTRDVRQAMRELGRGGALSALILDLRDNGGGLLEEAVALSDIFIKRGRIVSLRGREDGEDYRARSNGDIDIPLVVLVNSETASAAEIVADAIQGNGRGVVLGDRTFGKASVQSLFRPQAGSGYYIKLTVARYFGPDGSTLQAVGVRPDAVVTADGGGRIPPKLREEDLDEHLPRMLPGSARHRDEVEQGAACVAAHGRAQAIRDAEPARAIKFDNQLYVAADWAKCLVAAHPVVASEGVLTRPSVR